MSVPSWNPVINVEAPVVPIFPLITVLRPWLVIPAEPPKPAKGAAAPRDAAEARTLNVDVTVRLLVMETRQDRFDGRLSQLPTPKPPKIEPLAAVAVSVTCVPNA